MMQRIESIIIRQSDVSIMIEQQGEHIIPLFRYSVVQWSIAFRILKIKFRNRITEWNLIVNFNLHGFPKTAKI